MDTMLVASTLARAVQADALLNAAAQAQYAKAMTVELGFNRQQMRWASIAPFAVFFPAATACMNDGSRVHTVALLLGVADSTVMSGAVPTLQGLDWLVRAALPHSLRAMQDAVLTVLERCSLHEPDVEYMQDAFPMIYCSAALTVVETMPIGGRR